MPAKTKQRTSGRKTHMTSEQKGGGRGNDGRGVQQSVPLSRQRVNTAKAAKINSNGAETRVRHREYIADVAGVVAFGTVSYAVNPGIAATFPWLSTLADRYESYKFNKLNFVYETTKSASTNGSVQGLIDFDAADAAPTTKALFMGHANAVRAAVWQEFTFDARSVDLNKFAHERYVRSGALASNLDIKTYDVGNFFIGAAGCADTSAVGELYVEYDISFRTPQLNPAVSSTSAPLAQYLVRSGTLASTNFLGSTPLLYGADFCTGATNTLTFTADGDYLIELFSGAGGSITGSTGSTATVTQSATATSGFASIGVITATIGQTYVFSGVSGYGSTSTLIGYARITPQSQIPAELLEAVLVPRPDHDWCSVGPPTRP
jgi:hypothetical protein